MKEQLLSKAPKNLDEKSYQEIHPKKPFQEPILTKHETLVQNTHIGSTGATGAIGVFGGP